MQLFVVKDQESRREPITVWIVEPAASSIRGGPIAWIDREGTTV